jgi:hypothetical protein
VVQHTLRYVLTKLIKTTEMNNNSRLRIQWVMPLSLIFFGIIAFSLYIWLYPVHILSFESKIRAKGLQRKLATHFNEIWISPDGKSRDFDINILVGGDMVEIRALTLAKCKKLEPIFSVSSSNGETVVSGPVASKNMIVSICFSGEKLTLIILRSVLVGQQDLTEKSHAGHQSEGALFMISKQSQEELNLPMRKSELVRYFGEPISSERHSVIGDF